jgi:hypothetical protein
MCELVYTRALSGVVYGAIRSRDTQRLSSDDSCHFLVLKDYTSLLSSISTRGWDKCNETTELEDTSRDKFRDVPLDMGDGMWTDNGVVVALSPPLFASVVISISLRELHTTTCGNFPGPDLDLLGKLRLRNAAPPVCGSELSAQR